MDFLKKAKDALGKKSGGQSSTAGATGQPADGQPAAQKQDYGDKAFDFISKKTGHKFSPDQSEKITDGARGLYEKGTGKKVDPKYSN